MTISVCSGTGHGGHPLEVHPVVEDLALVVEEDGGQDGLPLLPLLPLQQGVKAPDGVLLQPRHGAAAVQNEDDLGQTLFHEKNLLILCLLTNTV